MTWDSGCDRPLRIFIIVNLAWAVVQFPLVSYEHLNHARTFPEENDIPMRPMGRSSSAPVDPVVSDPHRVNNAMARISPWLNRFKRLLDLFATCWFIVGNHWLYTTKDCTVSLTSNNLKETIIFFNTGLPYYRLRNFTYTCNPLHQRNLLVLHNYL